MKKNQGYNQIYETCKNHMHAYVLVETTDGQKYDGIITGLDNDNVYLAVPIGQDREDERQFGYGNPYYGGGYGGHGGYGGGYGGSFYPRRFRRLVLPLAALAALSLLPWY